MTSDFEAIRRARRQSEHIDDVLRKSEQISRDLDLWRAAGVNPPTPRRSINMPVVNIPAGVRLALYVLSGLGSVVVAYLFAKELIGEAEGALWAGIVALINAVAAANVSNHGRRDRGEVGEAKTFLVIVSAIVTGIVIVWLLSLLIR